MSATLHSIPVRPDAARRLAASTLRNARRDIDTAERHLDEVVLGLIAGASELSVVNSHASAIIREARERVFAARCNLDQIRLGLLAPDADTLTPNDEDDLATALQACLVGNEAARTDGGEFDRYTAADAGVRTGW
ncbi:hypothetical protein ACQVP2_27475 [Methylobacterium aquaticum]|uniref:hypothetical protein n=1 Tax=Methylobacterium aquaticum TaxID=270351 RepID=UPI003D16CF30